MVEHKKVSSCESELFPVYMPQLEEIAEIILWVLFFLVIELPFCGTMTRAVSAQRADFWMLASNIAFHRKLFYLSEWGLT
jgi:hypothetical protein